MNCVCVCVCMVTVYSMLIVHVILQVVYAAALVGMSLYGLKHPTDLPSFKLVAYFAMFHVVVWAIVGVFDRSDHCQGN